MVNVMLLLQLLSVAGMKTRFLKILKHPKMYVESQKKSEGKPPQLINIRLHKVRNGGYSAILHSLQVYFSPN